MTGRIERLKEKLFEMDGRTVFLERLSLMRNGYEKYNDKSPSVRYALIFDEILSGMSIVIDTDDLISGRVKEELIKGFTLPDCLFCLLCLFSHKQKTAEI